MTTTTSRTAAKAPAKTVKAVRATPLTAAQRLAITPGDQLAKGQLGLGTLQIEVVHVDANVARDWLERNVSNRPLRKGRLLEYRRDMLAGNWPDVGDPVRFDTSENMCDGQHRMIALTKADETQPGIAFDILVVRGVRPEDRHVIDTGTRRSAGDQLRIAGHRNHSMLAAAAKWGVLWDRRGNDTEIGGKTVTHGEILDYVDANANLQTVVDRVANTMRRHIDMPPGYVAAAYFLCRRLDEAMADEFYARLASGLGLIKHEPISALRNRLRELSRTRSNLTGDMWMSLIIRTWNAHREGRTMRAIPLVHKDGEPIPCPDIK